MLFVFGFVFFFFFITRFPAKKLVSIFVLGRVESVASIYRSHEQPKHATETKSHHTCHGGLWIALLHHPPHLLGHHFRVLRVEYGRRRDHAAWDHWDQRRANGSSRNPGHSGGIAGALEAHEALIVKDWWRAGIGRAVFVGHDEREAPAMRMGKIVMRSVGGHLFLPWLTAFKELGRHVICTCMYVCMYIDTYIRIHMCGYVYSVQNTAYVYYVCTVHGSYTGDSAGKEGLAGDLLFGLSALVIAEVPIFLLNSYPFHPRRKTQSCMANE